MTVTITMKAVTEIHSKEILTKFAEQNIAMIGYKKMYRVSLICIKTIIIM